MDDPAFTALISATRTEDLGDLQLNGLRDNVGVEGLRSDAEPVTTQVTELLTTQADCLSFLVQSDRSATFEPAVFEDGPLDAALASLYILIPATDADPLNPTAWLLASSSADLEADQCASS
jgi:hypothetical protein